MKSPIDLIFRIILGISFLILLGIRLTIQSKVLKEERVITENKLSLVSGSIAALTSLIFGAEYLFFPGTFRFSYMLEYPLWLRWLGVVILIIGLIIFFLAHYHLGRNFYSLVAVKEEQKLVTSGPYRWIRHPIYTGYILTYLAGGLVASKQVLTFVPVIFFSLMIINRIPREEAVMREEFGQDYLDLEACTGRLLPELGKLGSNIPLNEEEG
jgi:protein-S-isoprenylcysteine O-methyltransferase Ste14